MTVKPSTLKKDGPILELILLGTYTAKEIAARLDSPQRRVTVDLVYNVAYRHQKRFRCGMDRREAPRPGSPERRGWSPQ
jgi:hypothetical protein